MGHGRDVRHSSIPGAHPHHPPRAARRGRGCPVIAPVRIEADTARPGGWYIVIPRARGDKRVWVATDELAAIVNAAGAVVAPVEVTRRAGRAS